MSHPESSGGNAVRRASLADISGLSCAEVCSGPAAALSRVAVRPRGADPPGPRPPVWSGAAVACPAALFEGPGTLLGALQALGRCSPAG